MDNRHNYVKLTVAGWRSADRVRPCPGAFGRGCLVVIPEDRELCHFCTRSVVALGRAA